MFEFSSVLKGGAFDEPSTELMFVQELWPHLRIAYHLTKRTGLSMYMRLAHSKRPLYTFCKSSRGTSPHPGLRYVHKMEFTKYLHEIYQSQLYILHNIHICQRDLCCAEAGKCRPQKRISGLLFQRFSKEINASIA